MVLAPVLSLQHNCQRLRYFPHNPFSVVVIQAFHAVDECHPGETDEKISLTDLYQVVPEKTILFKLNLGGGNTKMYQQDRRTHQRHYQPVAPTKAGSVGSVIVITLPF